MWTGRACNASPPFSSRPCLTLSCLTAKASAARNQAFWCFVPCAPSIICHVHDITSYSPIYPFPESPAWDLPRTAETGGPTFFCASHPVPHLSHATPHFVDGLDRDLNPCLDLSLTPVPPPHNCLPHLTFVPSNEPASMALSDPTHPLLCFFACPEDYIFGESS